MNGMRKLGITGAALLALAGALGAGGAHAEETSASSECIACHTNLAAMDRYGAAAAGGAAEIAG